MCAKPISSLSTNSCQVWFHLVLSLSLIYRVPEYCFINISLVYLERFLQNQIVELVDLSLKGIRPLKCLGDELFVLELAAADLENSRLVVDAEL
jgi:hypothetical protein